MIATLPLSLVMAPFMLLSVYLYYLHVGHLDNYLALSQLFFIPVNILICIWELILYYNYDFIAHTFEKRCKDGYYKKPDQQGPLILFRDISFSEFFSMDTWAFVWIDYCRFDPSYANKTTFGYNIDVGNGHSTLLPSIFLLCSLIYPLASPQTTGIIALIFNYQMCYGAIIYYFAYFNCASTRSYNISRFHGLGVVLFANSFWIIFPILGMYGGAQLVYNNSFDIYK